MRQKQDEEARKALEEERKKERDRLAEEARKIAEEKQKIAVASAKKEETLKEQSSAYLALLHFRISCSVASLSLLS